MWITRITEKKKKGEKENRNNNNNGGHYIGFASGQNIPNFFLTKIV